MKKNKGFTITEVVTAIAIIGIISALFFIYYRSQKRVYDLDNHATQLASIVSQAKTKTVASEGGSSWGVHLEADKYTLFQGNQWVGSSNQTVYSLPDYISIHNYTDFVSCTAGGDDIVFSKVSGEPNQVKEISLRLEATSDYRTVCINNVGAISDCYNESSPPCPGDDK